MNIPERKRRRYNQTVLPELSLGDQVTLRKPHPCGGYDWRIVRLGADIGLECLKCGRRVLLVRRDLARRMKKHIPLNPPPLND